MDTEKAYPLLGEDLFENSMEAIRLYTHLSTTPPPQMHRYSLQFPDPRWISPASPYGFTYMDSFPVCIFVVAEFPAQNHSSKQTSRILTHSKKHKSIFKV